MGFGDTDDEVAFPDFDDPPPSPIKPYVHPRPVVDPVVNALDRDREAEILSATHKEVGKGIEAACVE